MILKLYTNPSNAATCKRCRGKITDEYRTRCGSGWMHVRCAAARCRLGREKNRSEKKHSIQMLSKDGHLVKDKAVIAQKLTELSRKGGKCKVEASKIKSLLQNTSSDTSMISRVEVGTEEDDTCTSFSCQRSANIPIVEALNKYIETLYDSGKVDEANAFNIVSLTIWRTGIDITQENIIDFLVWSKCASNLGAEGISKIRELLVDIETEEIKKARLGH